MNVAEALEGSAPGDVIVIDIGTYAETDLKLDGARIIGAGRHRTIIAPPTGSPDVPTLTVYRGRV